MTRENVRIGHVVWLRLVAEGGFVWTRSDGSKSVCFNRGRKPSSELAELLRLRRVELREYVDALHLFWEKSWAKSATSPGLGSEAVASKPLRVINGERYLLTNEKRGEK